MVPGRRPQPRLEPLALPLPAGRLPLRRPARRERAAGQARSGVRAARHRRVRRGPVLDRRGRLRQGRSHRPAHGGPGDQRRSRRATLHVLPTAWFRNTWSWEIGRAQAPAAGPGRRLVAIDHPFLGDLELLAGAGPDGVRPDRPVLRERDQQPAALRRARHDPVPQGRDQRPRRGTGAATVNPDRHGTKAALWYRLDGRAGGNGRAAPAAAARPAPGPRGRGGARRRLRPRSWPSAGRRPTRSTPS